MLGRNKEILRNSVRREKDMRYGVYSLDYQTREGDKYW